MSDQQRCTDNISSIYSLHSKVKQTSQLKERPSSKRWFVGRILSSHKLYDAWLRAFLTNKYILVPDPLCHITEHTWVSLWFVTLFVEHWTSCVKSSLCLFFSTCTQWMYALPYTALLRSHFGGFELLFYFQCFCCLTFTQYHNSRTNWLERLFYHSRICAHCPSVAVDACWCLLSMATQTEWQPRRPVNLELMKKESYNVSRALLNIMIDQSSETPFNLFHQCSSCLNLVESMNDSQNQSWSFGPFQSPAFWWFTLAWRSSVWCCLWCCWGWWGRYRRDFWSLNNLMNELKQTSHHVLSFSYSHSLIISFKQYDHQSAVSS